MGTEARIIAFGPFSLEISHFLEYPYGWYENVKRQKKVVTVVIKTITTRSSEEVAECFGAKLFDFGTHCDLVPNHEKLRKAVEDRVIEENELESVLMLHEHGFEFMLSVDT